MNPQLNLFFDTSQASFYKKNNQNFINALTVQQLPALQNLALLDIYLSGGNIVEPHWHPNAAELVYVVSGELIVSVLNPFTNMLMTYRLKPQQTVLIPMGWFHWDLAVADNTHFIAVFDNNAPQTVLGSSVLSKTPKEIFQLSYGVNGEQLSQVLSPIKGPVVIGPPAPARGGDGVQWRVGNAQRL